MVKYSFLENFVQLRYITNAGIAEDQGSAPAFIILTIFFFFNLDFNFHPFSTNVLLLFPFKASENRMFSDVCREYRSGTLVENELSLICYKTLSLKLLSIDVILVKLVKILCRLVKQLKFLCMIKQHDKNEQRQKDPRYVKRTHT